jgi:TonB family protein
MTFDKSEALRKAEQHFLKGETSAAITVYREIVETDPYDFSSINKLGDLYAGAGRIKDAINDFSRIADLHLANGSRTRAAYLLKKTLELDPADAAARMKLGEVYSHENMLESAHEAFILAGAVFMRGGDIDKAIEANQKALAIKPDSQQARSAIATLENKATLNESRNSPDQVKPANSGPVTTSDSAPKGGKRNQTTGSLDHLLSGFDDDFVVQQISKAEALVGFGDVTQAVAMLKAVLHSAPDKIAVHIKLKDIYLRAEMMSEACVEYKELARIYAARGETARAKDYEIRAQRLNQMIAPPVNQPNLAQPNGVQPNGVQPNAQASRRPKKAEPRPALSKSDGANNQRSSETREKSNRTLPAVEETLRRGEKVATAFALEAPMPTPRAETETADNPFNSASRLKLEVKETALALASKPEQALIPISSSSSLFATSVLGLTQIETKARPLSGRRVYAALIIVICLTAIIVTALKGLSMYDARLNKQYEELIYASPINSSPDPPQLPALDDSQNVDKDIVTLDPQPTEVIKPSESGTEPREINEAAPKTLPALRGEPQKPTKMPGLSPPLVSPALDSRAGIDRNSPGEISAGVPENPAAAAPAPAAPLATASATPAPPRKASVAIAGEAIRRVQPTYPLSAKSLRQGGAVTVEIIINENGDVSSARAISGSDLLRSAAVSAAKAWKFKPSMRDGRPVKSASTITFNFKL